MPSEPHPQPSAPLGEGSKLHVSLCPFAASRSPRGARVPGPRAGRCGAGQGQERPLRGCPQGRAHRPGRSWVASLVAVPTPPPRGLRVPPSPVLLATDSCSVSSVSILDVGLVRRLCCRPFSRALLGFYFINFISSEGQKSHVWTSSVSSVVVLLLVPTSKPRPFYAFGVCVSVRGPRGVRV